MLISIFLVLLITAGGFALSYVLTREAGFLLRLAYGCVAGSAIFGTLIFIFSFVTGFGIPSIAVALVFTLAPLALFNSTVIRGRAGADWRRAKGRLQGGDLKKLLRFSYYLFFFVLFWFFFGQAMYATSQGIFTGGSQNLGDLPFHIGTIAGFTDGNNFPPQNPSFAGVKFSYPFISDLAAAAFIKFGAAMQDALFIQDIAWAFSLLVILERFIFRLTGDELAAKLGPLIFFFSGGLGFFRFISDFLHQSSSLFEYIRHLPFDYTIGDNFRWGNSLVVLFITQRSILLGMPLALIVLNMLWGLFAGEPAETQPAKKHKPPAREHSDDGTTAPCSLALLAVSGLLAGALVLVHLHSLAVLFVVTAFLFAAKPGMWRHWLTFGVFVAAVAVPELAWSTYGTATRTSEFFSWFFGWNKGDQNFFWFWFINTGLTIPVAAFGLLLVYSGSARVGGEKAVAKERSGPLLLFYVPFLVCFIIANAARLAPWEWDNIKVLIYWFVGSVPFIALALSWMLRRNLWLKMAAAACFVLLTFSGGLDVWRTVSGQTKIQVFNAQAVQAAELIRQKTPANAVFLNAATYNTAVALSGRLSVMRYPGHLGSHGIDYREREADVEDIYSGSADADQLLRKYLVDYVLVSPEEMRYVNFNENAFYKYPVIINTGSYRVYKIAN